MHTLKVIFGGFLLLGVCLLLGRWIGGATAMVVATTIKYFIALAGRHAGQYVGRRQ
jgi:hypothetical protein